MRVPLRVLLLRRPWGRLRDAVAVATCRHEYESHTSADVPGTCVYLCRKCSSGWKIT